jgi:large subunit ribosomal protein L7/L12
VSLTRDQVIEYLEGLSILELSQLITELQRRVGLPEPLRVPDPYPYRTGGVPLPPPPDEYAFSVRLLDPGPDRIAVLKIVRARWPIGLAEAKQLVASAPVLLAEDLTKPDACELARRLEEAGARVEVS